MSPGLWALLLLSSSCATKTSPVSDDSGGKLNESDADTDTDADTDADADADADTDSGVSWPDNAWRQISVGGQHMCGTLRNGKALCWGRNDYGQLNVPSGLWRQVSAAEYGTTCGLRLNGVPTCWGLEEVNGTPEHLVSMDYFDSGNAQQYACGITDVGEITCWGDPSHPRNFPTDQRFSMVSTSYGYACALTRAGQIECWPSQRYYTPEPLEEAPPTGTFMDLCTADHFACALRTDGTMACWGEELTDWNAQDPSEPAPGTFLDVACEGASRCEVSTDHDLSCAFPRSNGVILPSAEFVQIAFGSAGFCGILVDGSAACWDGVASPIPIPE